jgi:hypothetical protein
MPCEHWRVDPIARSPDRPGDAEFLRGAAISSITAIAGTMFVDSSAMFSAMLRMRPSW